MQTPIRFILFIVVGLSLTACAVNRTAPSRQLDASIVPVDFNPGKHVLLVAAISPADKKKAKNEKVTKEMEGLLKKYYPYKFEIVSMEDINSKNSKYADTSIYKYAMLNSLTGVQHTTYTTIKYENGNQHTLSPSATTTYISYHFVDRTNNKVYGESYKSAWLKTAVEAFANTIKKAKQL